jgi:hypothetical protein
MALGLHRNFFPAGNLEEQGKPPVAGDWREVSKCFLSTGRTQPMESEAGPAPGGAPLP